jgi:hypothetical protein
MSNNYQKTLFSNFNSISNSKSIKYQKQNKLKKTKKVTNTNIKKQVKIIKNVYKHIYKLFAIANGIIIRK